MKPSIIALTAAVIVARPAPAGAGCLPGAAVGAPAATTVRR